MNRVLVLILALSFFTLTKSASWLPAPGCLAHGTNIPSVPASEVNDDLSDRINEIKNGDTRTWKHFENREKCLPQGWNYSEYRLYPSKADANRIVRDEANYLFYFTSDHYESFYRITSYSYDTHQI